MIVQIDGFPVLKIIFHLYAGLSHQLVEQKEQASKRWQEVWLIPLSLLTVAVDSSLQQSVQSQSHRHESGKNQTKTEIPFQPYFQNAECRQLLSVSDSAFHPVESAFGNRCSVETERNSQ